MSHDRGSGVVFSEVEDDAVRIRPRIDYGRLCVPPGGATETEILALGAFQDARRDVLGLFNWDETTPLELEETCDRLGLPPSEGHVGFDYWADRFVGPFGATLRSSVEPASCRIISVRSLADHPLLVSTSRHITQGVVDVREESWDEKSLTLRGRSLVVGRETYELRIFVPIEGTGDGSALRVADVTLSSGDERAGVRTDWHQRGAEVRARLRSPESREVAWGVRFAKRP